MKREKTSFKQFIIYMVVVIVMILTVNTCENLVQGSPLSDIEIEMTSLKSNMSVKMLYDTIHLERGTRYNPVVGQCDADPLITADMSFIDTVKLENKEIRWVALSRDLLKRWNGPINYGDTILIFSASKPIINGKWVVHDSMNKRYKKTIDFLYHKSNMIPKLGICRDCKILLNKRELWKIRV